MSSSSDLRTALAATIADYRAGEIAPIDAAHVDCWIKQFPAAMRDPILAELLHVFERTYFSRARVQNFIDSVINSSKFAGANPSQFWRGVKVLDVQTAGNSQKELLALLADSLEQQHGVAIESCGNKPHSYLYLDDAVFSGGRVRFDIIRWVKESAPAKAKLSILVVGLHTLGQWYSTEKIQEAADAVGKSIEVSWQYEVSFEDRKSKINNSDVLRPTCIPGNMATQGYVLELGDAPILRPVGGHSPLGVFSGEVGRHLLEQEFLVAGVQIRKMCPHFNQFMRPLGNMLFESLGFGSTIVTYRNCPNNAPLVLWAGNPWYPLFPRKNN